MKRDNQVLSNILYAEEVQKHTFNDAEPWSEVLASAACAIHSIRCTTLQEFPVELVFSHDMQLNIKYIVDCEVIRLRKKSSLTKITIRKIALG